MPLYAWEPSKELYEPHNFVLLQVFSISFLIGLHLFSNLSIMSSFLIAFVILASVTLYILYSVQTSSSVLKVQFPTLY